VGRFYVHARGDPFALAEVKCCQAVPADAVDVHEANARLIAAAPALFSVLTEVVALAHDCPVMTKKLRETMFRAEDLLETIAPKAS
jgi:hypothetical protein